MTSHCKFSWGNVCVKHNIKLKQHKVTYIICMFCILDYMCVCLCVHTVCVYACLYPSQ